MPGDNECICNLNTCTKCSVESRSWDLEGLTDLFCHKRVAEKQIWWISRYWNSMRETEVEVLHEKKDLYTKGPVSYFRNLQKVSCSWKRENFLLEHLLKWRNIFGNYRPVVLSLIPEKRQTQQAGSSQQGTSQGVTGAASWGKQGRSTQCPPRTQE